jgi:hypothetical protein
MSPSVLTNAETPATTTRTITATQPRPWITDPMARPAAPPKIAIKLIRLTRYRYEPPRSLSVPSRPPIAGSRPVVLSPTANPTASGTHIPSAARIMSGHGGRAGFGRTSSTSQSGKTAARISAARVLIRAGVRLSLIAAPPRRRFFLPNGPW